MTRRRRLLRRQYHTAKYLVLSIINRLLIHSGIPDGPGTRKRRAKRR